MQAVLAAFAPNRAVSRNIMRLVVLVELGLALALWVLSPYELLPNPAKTFGALGKLWMVDGLARELWSSFITNLQALAITAAISVGLAYLTVIPAIRPAVAVISKFRFMSLVGLSFLFTLLTGGGHWLKIWLLVFGMSVFFVTSMAGVVAAIPKEKFDYARTLRMGEWRVTWEVVIRGTFHEAIEVLRQNAAIGWMMLTMVEGITRSEGGIGVMLLNQNKHFRLEEVFATQLVVLAVAVLQDYAIGGVKNLLCPYAALKLERR